MKALIYWITSTLILIQWTQPAPSPLDELNINIRIDDGPDQSAPQRHPLSGQLQPPSRQPLPASDYGGYKYRGYKKNGGNKKYRFNKYASNKYGRNKSRREGTQSTRCKTPTPKIDPESQDIKEGDRIYAGLFLPVSSPSGKIKFNICKKGSTNGQYDCSHPGGEEALFGAPNQAIGRPSTLPTKVMVTENVKKAGITKVDDVRFIITSVEDLSGNKMEGEVAHPIRVFRPRIRTHDFYTIFFNTSVIHPPAIEMTKKVKIKIESQNEEIFHVNNEDDYEKCNDEEFFCMTPNLYMDKEFIRGNGNNHNGSYYFFDRDGLPRNCLGHFAESSRGSKIQIIIDPIWNP